MQHLRDMLSLSRMLRRFAEEQTGDNNHDLFVSTAAALEDRAHALATAEDVVSRERDVALHARVDCFV